MAFKAQTTTSRVDGEKQRLEDEHNRRKDVVGSRKDGMGDALLRCQAYADTEPHAALSWSVCGELEADNFRLLDGGRTVELVHGGRYGVCLQFAAGLAGKYAVYVNGKRACALGPSLCLTPPESVSFVALLPARARLQVVNRSASKMPAGSFFMIAAF